MKKEKYTTVSHKESFLESQLADENILDEYITTVHQPSLLVSSQVTEVNILDESIKSLMDTKSIKKQIELQKQILILENKILILENKINKSIALIKKEIKDLE